MKKLMLLVTFFAFGATSAYAITTGDSPAPFGNDIFVRGGFNGWGLDNPMTWDPVNEAYTAIVNIDAGDWEFKIADEGWANPDFGPLNNPVVVLGEESDIGTSIGMNFLLSIVTPGPYLFTLQDLTPNLTKGNLFVTQVPLPPALLLLASGFVGLSLFGRRR